MAKIGGLVGGKGLGVVARRTYHVACTAGTIVALYELRVVDRSRAPPGDYRVDVTRYQPDGLD